MGKVGGAKHAAPKHARGAQHAKHAKYQKRSNDMFYAVGAVCVAAVLAIGIFTVPAAIAPHSVSAAAGAVAGVATESAKSAKAVENQAVQAQGGKAEAVESGQSSDPAQSGAPTAQTQSGEASTPIEQTAQAPEAEPVASNAAESVEGEDAAPVESEVATQSAAENAQSDAADQSEAAAPAVEGEQGAAEQVEDKSPVTAETPNELLVNRALELQSQSDEAEVQFYQSLLEDGATVDQATAESLAKNPVSYTANVKPMLQEGVLDSGCEIFSLAIALDSMGIEADPVKIADEYLDFEGSIQEGGYMGSPYWGGGGFPSAIAKAANAYLGDAGLKYRAHDLTGNSLQAIVGLVERGYPVLVWVTIDYEEPFLYNDVVDQAQWYANEHCVVMYGAKDGKVLISDPLEGFVELDVAEFANLYELCGSMALFVR